MGYEDMENNVLLNRKFKTEKQNEIVAVVALLYSDGWRMVKEGRTLETAQDVLIEYIDSIR